MFKARTNTCMYYIRRSCLSDQKAQYLQKGILSHHITPKGSWSLIFKKMSALKEVVQVYLQKNTLEKGVVNKNKTKEKFEICTIVINVINARLNMERNQIYKCILY